MARFALIITGKGDPELLTAYRPLYMLHIAEKVLEKLIRRRLAEAIRTARDLSPRQFGFRIGISTVNAVMEAIDAVHRAEVPKFRRMEKYARHIKKFIPRATLSFADIEELFV